MRREVCTTTGEHWVIKTRFSTGARVSACVHLTAEDGFFDAQLLGHAQLETTQVYTESRTARRRER